jgi:uncharacterized protein YqeY
MTDFSLQFLTAKRLIEDYYNAMISQDKSKAAQIANQLVEASLKLEDIANGN